MPPSLTNPFHPHPSNRSINAPQTPKQAAPNCTAPPSFPIQVDEVARTVTGERAGWGSWLPHLF